MKQPATYSLWLEPVGDVSYKLQERIKKLSKKHQTPFFTPHVTLLGGIKSSLTQSIPFTNMLAAGVQPFELTLTKAGYRDRFYQSLFIYVAETTTLRNLRSKAQQMFDMKNEDGYMPHLSLLYGDLSPKEKQRTLNLTGRDFNIAFQANYIVLMKTDGTPDQWKRVHTAMFNEK